MNIKISRDVVRENNNKKSKLASGRQLYTDKCKALCKQLNESKREYYSSRIKQHKTNNRELFRLSKDLIGFNGEIALPSHTERISR